MDETGFLNLDKENYNDNKKIDHFLFPAISVLQGVGMPSILEKIKKKY